MQRDWEDSPYCRGVAIAILRNGYPLKVHYKSLDMNFNDNLRIYNYDFDASNEIVFFYPVSIVSFSFF